MTEKIFLLQRSHRVTLDEFFDQTVGIHEYQSLERAQECMHSITGCCIIIKGDIIDSNCIEDEE